MINMGLLDKIQIDFQLLDTRDPKTLVVMDSSVWGFIEDKPAIIEITLPGSQNKRTYNFVKSKNNVFNSSNLLISKVGEYKDLADGVYKITVKGSPDTNCKHRDFLKTDKVRLLIGELYLEDFYSCKNVKDDKLRILRKIHLDLNTAEILTTKGDIKKASLILSDVYSRVREYIRCRD